MQMVLRENAAGNEQFRAWEGSASYSAHTEMCVPFCFASAGIEMCHVLQVL